MGRILAEQFRKLGVRVGEPVEITKAEVANGNGRKSIQWQVARVGFAPGEQPDGTFAVARPEPPSELEQKLAASIAMVESRKQAQQAQSASQTAMPVWADRSAPGALMRADAKPNTAGLSTDGRSLMARRRRRGYLRSPRVGGGPDRSSGAGLFRGLQPGWAAASAASAGLLGTRAIASSGVTGDCSW